MNYLSPADYFAVPRPLTSRQKNAMVEYQRDQIKRDRERDALREEWRAHDAPAIREERNCHVQNWGMGS